MSWESLLSTADQAVKSGFSRATTYTPEGGDPVEVRGIYDAAYVSATPGTPNVSTSAPAVFYLLADLPSDPEHDDPTIVVGTESFKVIEVKKDSNAAGVLLVLTEVA